MTTRDIRLDALSSHEVACVWDHVQGLFARHFELPVGYNVLASQADATFGRWLRVVEVAGRPVGAVLVRGFRTQVEGRETVVFRAAACVDNEYRRRCTAVRFVSRVVLGYWLRHPWARIYYVDPVIHFSSFLVIHKHVALAYPTLHDGMPARIQRLFGALKRGLLSAYEFTFANPYVCRIPFNTVESAEDARAWQRRAESDRYVSRFIHAGAAERDRGLLCIVPIDVWNVALSVPRILGKVGLRLMSVPARGA